jgi:hypothetical protein
MSKYPKKNMVCFASAFAYQNAPNITHMTLDGERTACGRKGWETVEGWIHYGPDCRVCHKAWERLPKSERGETLSYLTGVTKC